MKYREVVIWLPLFFVFSLKTGIMPLLNQIYLYLLLLMPGVQHPFYVSVCQIDHNSQNQSLEITLKVFTDDLEKALEESVEHPLFLGTDREYASSDSLIDVYLTEKLQLKVNNQPVSMTYLGKEVEMQVTWCYIEVKNVSSVRELQVINTIFLEMYDTQTNLVNVRVGNDKKSMILNQGKKQDEVDF